MPLVAKIGNVVKEDPMLRFGKNGKPFAKFSLQVKPYAPKDEPQPETVYYEVTAFGSLAEHVAQCVVKGNRVVVVGNGKIETWGDNNEHSKKVILADGVGHDLRFITAAPYQSTEPTPQAPTLKPEPVYETEEEPF